MDSGRRRARVSGWDTGAVLEALRAQGLLMLADGAFPSVTTMVACEPVKGSWWGHPRGREIYAVANELEESDEVMVTRLIRGKVTFVHRELWSVVAAVGRSGQGWQTKGLSEPARRILRQVEGEGRIRAHEAAGLDAKAAGKEMTALEVRLLALGGQVHTDAGHHVKVLESWDSWMTAQEFEPEPVEAEAARCLIEERTERAGGASAVRGLPWQKRMPAGR